MENFRPESQYLSEDEETIVPESSSREAKKAEAVANSKEISIPGLAEATTVEDIIEAVKQFPSKIGNSADFADLQSTIKLAVLKGELGQVPEEGGLRAKLKEILVTQLQKEITAQTDNSVAEQFGNGSGETNERGGEDSLEDKDNVAFG